MRDARKCRVNGLHAAGGGARRRQRNGGASGNCAIAEVPGEVERHKPCHHDDHEHHKHDEHSSTHGYLAFMPAKSPLPSLRCDVRQESVAGAMT